MTAEHTELLPCELRDAGYIEIGHLAVFTDNVLIASRVGAIAAASRSTHGFIKDPRTAHMVYWCLLGLVENDAMYGDQAV